ncbi:MAG TPA: hypothetical protein VE007_04050 [Thermoanaerobaculia bacterium]|nr:hypothetical protein [Thermoanaerobaculia bacterium]
MNRTSIALPLALFAVPLAMPLSARVDAPLVCNIRALTDAQREGHLERGRKLLGAVVRTTELPDGYEIAFDLSRLTDSKGAPWCVVEVAEWVELEARCCPFLDFQIDVAGKGGPVKLRLTGRAAGVKAFLKSEIPVLGKGV